MNRLFKLFLAVAAVLTMLSGSTACTDTNAPITSQNDNTSNDRLSPDIKNDDTTTSDETSSAISTDAETTAEEAESISISSDPFGYPSSMSAEDIYTDVLQKEWIVFNASEIICGIELWHEFYTKAMNGEPSSVKIANYYQDTEYEFEKDKYPLISLTDISYDGSSYKILNCNGGEDKYSENNYKYLIKYELENQDAYILVNENSYTYKQLYDSLFSANSFKHIDFKAVMKIPK